MERRWQRQSWLWQMSRAMRQLLWYKECYSTNANPNKTLASQHDNPNCPLGPLISKRPLSEIHWNSFAHFITKYLIFKQGKQNKTHREKLYGKYYSEMENGLIEKNSEWEDRGHHSSRWTRKDWVVTIGHLALELVRTSQSISLM